MVNWVDSDTALAEAVGAWGDVIGLDTEFIRTDTFYPMPGLYQIAAGGDLYLLDPLAISDWQPFIDVLTNTQTVKVMHACQEDMELLHHHLGVTTRALFDTQFANAFVTADFSLSYAALVSAMLDVDLDKHETRSNWLARPLSDDQITYAIQDVMYLEPMYETLSARLAELDRSEWFTADMRERGRYVPADPETYYLGIKKAWRMSGEQLGALSALCAWRERQARDENVPRNRVVWDDNLYEFACRSRLSESDVAEVLPRRIARRYADDLTRVHAEGLDRDDVASLPKPLSSAQGALVKRLRDSGRAAAERLGLAQELLARRRDLEECVRCYEDRSELSGHYDSWRGAIVGDDFRAVLGS